MSNFQKILGGSGSLNYFGEFKDFVKGSSLKEPQL